ncbi:uncharacterized protein LOC134689887 [Mytilus trossulus]|uniref:uncharacterized protein LOC134689887 n=1 Tax=Mytilus trossulus TaxID=6551 RepID=UPI003004F850
MEVEVDERDEQLKDKIKEMEKKHREDNKNNQALADFTEKEIDAIVDNVKENSVMLFSKFSNVASNTRKKEAWKKVQNAVNAVSFTNRTTEEIKTWDDIKRGTKKKATSITNDREKTGGGVPSFIALNKMEEDVVAVVGEERVFGISTGCDTMKRE